MTITVAKSKRFGLIPLGNPTLRNYVKHESISDVLSDKKCFAFNILEVRHNQEFHCILDSSKIKVYDKATNTEIFISSNFIENEIEKAISNYLESEQIKLRLLGYTYKQD